MATRTGACGLAGWLEVVRRAGERARRWARRAATGRGAPEAPAGHVTLAQAAAVLGLRVGDLRTTLDDGYLASFGAGRHRFVAVADLVDYMDRHPRMSAGFRPELLPADE